MSELYTMKDVSKILKVGLNRVYELKDAGEIKFAKIGTYKTTKEELEKFIQKQMSESK